MGLAAVQHIATIAALQIATRLRDYEFRRREGAETLAELLAGTLDTGSAVNRLTLAGFAADATLQLVAVGAGAGSPDDQAVARTLYELGEPHLMLLLGELYVLLPEGSPALEAMSSIEGIRLGLSRGFAAAAGLATARREARWALFRAVDMSERVVRSDDDRDIGWLPAGAAAQREVVERILGPAIEHDRTHRASPPPASEYAGVPAAALRGAHEPGRREDERSHRRVVGAPRVADPRAPLLDAALRCRVGGSTEGGPSGRVGADSIGVA